MRIPNTIRHIRQAQEASGVSLSVVAAQLGGLIEAGLAAALDAAEPPVRLLGCGLDLPHLEEAVATEQPNVAVLADATVGDFAIFSRLREVRPGIGLVVIGHGLSKLRGTQLLVCGADACVADEVSSDQVVTAVRVAAEGAQIVVAVDDGAGWPRSTLTSREEEVIRLLRDGYKDAAAAHELGVSVETVRTHVRHIYAKLGVHSRRQLRSLAYPVSAETLPR